MRLSAGLVLLGRCLHNVGSRHAPTARSLSMNGNETPCRRRRGVLGQARRSSISAAESTADVAQQAEMTVGQQAEDAQGERTEPKARKLQRRNPLELPGEPPAPPTEGCTCSERRRRPTVVASLAPHGRPVGTQVGCKSQPSFCRCAEMEAWCHPEKSSQTTPRHGQLRLRRGRRGRCGRHAVRCRTSPSRYCCSWVYA